MNNSAQEFICRLISFGEVDSDVGYFLDKITEDDFMTPDQKIIFRGIKSVFRRGEQINLWTVTQELRKDVPQDKPEPHSVVVLRDMQEDAHWPVLRDSARRLREESVKLKLMRMGAEMAKDPNIIVKLSHYQKKIEELSQEQVKTGSAELLLQALKNRESPNGFQTKFQKLDQFTKGMKRGHFWVLGGYSNTGKTRFALQLCDQAQLQKAKVCFLSLEMRGDDLMEIYLKIKINRGMKEEKAANEIVTNEMQVPTHLIRLEQIVRYISENDFDCVFIDYLQLIITSDKSEYERMSNVATTLALLSKSKNVFICALSQVSEEYKKNENFRTLGFKGSGAIGSAADVGIVLHREFEAEGDFEEVPFKIILRKNRFGQTGMFTHKFNTKTAHISYDPYI